LCHTFGLGDGGMDKQSLVARLAGSPDGKAVGGAKGEASAVGDDVPPWCSAEEKREACVS
jgi:hypothetical protein